MIAITHLALFLLPAAVGTEQMALVVGSNLGLPHETPLKFAVADARRVHQVLLDTTAAEVVLLEEPTAAALDQHLLDLRRAVARRAARGKQVFLTFYYAGHADAAWLHVNGERYALAGLAAHLEASMAAVVVAVVDACRTGSGLSERGLERVGGPEIDLVMPEQPTGTVWIRSTSRGAAAQESDSLAGGVFTHFWVSALRGAADRNLDGLVTLDEAYGFAATRTHGFTATAKALMQQPTYQIDLSGAHGLVLTRPLTAPSLVTLPAHAEAVYVIRQLATGAAVMAVEARTDRPVRVALPAGKFEVLRRAGEDVAALALHLPWGGEVQVSAGDFHDLPALEHAVRGGLPRSPAQLWAGIHGGVAFEPNIPVTWQRAQGVFGWRLAAPYDYLQLNAALGWQGREFPLRSEGSWLRSDSIFIEAGAGLVLDVGAVTLSVEAGARLELVFQQESRQPAERFAAAALSGGSNYQSLRGGLLVGGSLLIPMIGSFAWELRVAGGGLVQPGAAGSLAVVPLLELTSGPGFSW